jgi:hypothetical protein
MPHAAPLRFTALNLSSCGSVARYPQTGSAKPLRSQHASLAATIADPFRFLVAHDPALRCSGRTGQGPPKGRQKADALPGSLARLPVGRSGHPDILRIPTILSLFGCRGIAPVAPRPSRFGGLSEPIFAD